MFRHLYTSARIFCSLIIYLLPIHLVRLIPLLARLKTMEGRRVPARGFWGRRRLYAQSGCHQLQECLGKHGPRLWTHRWIWSWDKGKPCRSRECSHPTSWHAALRGQTFTSMYHDRIISNVVAIFSNVKIFYGPIIMIIITFTSISLLYDVFLIILF